MDIVNYLINEGSEYLRTTVGLAQSLASSNGNLLENIANHHDTITKLLSSANNNIYNSNTNEEDNSKILGKDTEDN